MLGIEKLQGQVVGSWRLSRLLARGGMSAVYEAHHRVTGKRGALKVLDPGSFDDPASRERFRREVTASDRIGHPGIVDILDAGTDEELGVHYVVMELLRGESLREFLSRAPPSASVALKLVDEILDAMAAAHSVGIVHRDLKPENIFVCNAGDGTNREGRRIKVIDFGIARDMASGSATATATAIGTPHYMAPEQMKSARKVGPTADVWSVAVILYEMLAGRPPFHGETVHAVILSVCSHEPPPLPTSVPPLLAEVILRSLSKQPERRPGDAAQLQRLLHSACAEKEPPVAPTQRLPPGIAPDALDPSHPSRAQTSEDSHRATWRYAALGAAFFAGAMAIVGWFAMSGEPAPRAHAGSDTGRPHEDAGAASNPRVLVAAPEPTHPEPRRVVDRSDAGRPLRRPPRRVVGRSDAGQRLERPSMRSNHTSDHVVRTMQGESLCVGRWTQAHEVLRGTFRIEGGAASCGAYVEDIMAEDGTWSSYSVPLLRCVFTESTVRAAIHNGYGNPDDDLSASCTTTELRRHRDGQSDRIYARVR